MTDPTRLPPPCYTLDRANEVYVPAFMRAVEFIAYQEIRGDWVEFGTHNGFTAGLLARMMRQFKIPDRLLLFDSFEGLPAIQGVDVNSPEARSGRWKAGFPNDRVENVAERISAALRLEIGDRLCIHPGWFKDTVKHLPDTPLSIVHIDCDLYESTVTVLKAIFEREMYQQGTVFLFDDWNNGRASKRFGERQAMAMFPFGAEPWFSYGWHGQAFICHRG